MPNKTDVKITKERQRGLLPLTAVHDELTKSGKVSKRLVRQDTKEIAIMFAKLNNVGQPSGMSYKHCSDLLGVPYTLLKQWLSEHDTLIVENDSQYLQRLAHREKVLLDSLFTPVDLAIQELNSRLASNPDSFTNTELLTLITRITDQYTKVYAMRLQRESLQSNTNNEATNTLTELKTIFDSAKDRLVIDQTDK